MNLAQLVSLERLDKDDRPAQRSPLPPMGVVTHTCKGPVVHEEKTLGPEFSPKSAPVVPSRSGCADAIRSAIAKSSDLYVALDEVCTGCAPEYGERQVRVTLYNLVSQGDLVRQGRQRHARFGLSDKGRAKLKPPP